MIQAKDVRKIAYAKNKIPNEIKKIEIQINEAANRGEFNITHILSDFNSNAVEIIKNIILESGYGIDLARLAIHKELKISW